MNPRVRKVRPLRNYRLEIEFENSEIRQFDLTPYLDRGIFRELKNIAYFSRVQVSIGSIQWPHGQDLCPDTLYEDSQVIETVWIQIRIIRYIETICARASCWVCGIPKIFTRLNPWYRNYELCLHTGSKIFKRSQCLSPIQWWLVRKCGSERDNQQPPHSWSPERSFGVFKIFLGFLADAGMEMRIWYCTRITL